MKSQNLTLLGGRAEGPGLADFKDKRDKANWAW